MGKRPQEPLEIFPQCLPNDRKGIFLANVKFIIHGAGHDAEQSASRAHIAEECGYYGFFVGESQWNTLDPFQTLTFCATRTRTIRLGTGVTSMLFRSPYQLANAAATLNHISNGRAILGIGTGDEPELGFKSTKMDRFEDELKRIRVLLHGGSLPFVSVEGKNVEESLTAGRLPVPLFIAAEGPRTLELAGRVADGVILGTGFDQDVLKWAKGKVSQGAIKAGRSPKDIEILVAGMIVIDSNGSKAKDLARRRIANRAYHNFRSTLETVPEEELEGVKKFLRAFDITKPIEEKSDPEMITDYLIRRFSVAGTPKECKTRIEELVNLGATSFMVTPPFNIYDQVMKDWADVIVSEYRN